MLHLENLGERRKLRYAPHIRLRYETTPDQLRCILVEIRRVLYAHPKVLSDPARVRLSEFGASSLDLAIHAYVDTQDYSEYLEIAEDLNLRIMDVVFEAGSRFAVLPPRHSCRNGVIGANSTCPSFRLRSSSRCVEPSHIRWRGLRGPGTAMKTGLTKNRTWTEDWVRRRSRPPDEGI
jgi:hypothetical protein